jgi:hypothetical protein
MPRIVITHDVVDLDGWLKGKGPAGRGNRVGWHERR